MSAHQKPRKTTHRTRPQPRDSSDEIAATAVGPGLALRFRQIGLALVFLGAGLGPLAPALEGTLMLRLIVQALFVLAGALWVMSMAVEGRIRLHSSGLGFWLGLIAVMVVVTTLNASYKYPAVLASFMWLSSMVAFLFVFNEARSRHARWLLLGALGASAFVVSLHGLHQILVELPAARRAFDENPDAVLRSLNLSPDMEFDFRGRLGTNRIFSTFLLPNSLAGFLILLLPVHVGIVLDWFAERRLGESRAMLLWRGVLFVPILLALYFTKSKGGWLAFMAAMTLFLFWAFGNVLWRRRMQTLCVILCMLIITVISQASGLLTPLRDYASSSGARLGYWRAGVVIVERSPVLGVGLDNFADHYAAVKRSADEEVRRAHNDYLQITGEMGLIGLLVYLMFLSRFWRRVARRPSLTLPDSVGEEEPATYEPVLIVLAAIFIFALEVFCGGTFRSSEGLLGWLWPAILLLGWIVFFSWTTQRSRAELPARTAYATIGIGCGLAAFLIHSLVDFDHYVGGIFQTAWIMMALLLSARSSRKSHEYAVDRKIGSGSRFVLALGSTCLSVFLLYGFVVPVGEAHVRQQRAADWTIPLAYDERLQELLAAIEQNPLDAQNHALLSDVLLAMLGSGAETTRQGVPVIGEAIIHAQRAVELNPARSQYYSRLGFLYELRWRMSNVHTDYVKALAASRRAEECFPTNPDHPLSLARLHDMGRQYDVALGKYFRARTLSAEQSQRTRRFSKLELKELDERINVLKVANTRHETPPPLSFTRPRLLGWPAHAFGKPSSEG